MNKPFNSRSSIRKEEHNNDTFITPKNAIIPLIEALDIQDGDRIYDGCCGYGDNENNIAKVIAKHKDIQYYGTDLEMGIKFVKGNIEIDDEKNYNNNMIFINKSTLYENIFKSNILVSNPPFNQKDIFMGYYLELFRLDKNKKVALLMPLTTLGGAKYKKLYDAYGYPSILAFSKRVQFIDGKSSNVDVGWFIWDNKPTWIKSV